MTVVTAGGRPAHKAPADSRVTLAQIMSAHDTNLYGTVHGGVVMKLIDDTAAAAAGRHSDGPAVTVSVDAMRFLAPVRAGSLLTVTAELDRAGRTSMGVAVAVTAEPWNTTGHGPPAEVATARLTFVAIDASGAPRPVPALAAPATGP